MVKRQLEGFILVSVLAILALMSFLIVSVRVNTAAVTKEFAYLNKRPVQNLYFKTGLDLVAANIISGDPEVPVQRGSISATYSGVNISGSFENLAGRVDLNRAPYQLVQAAFIVSGINEETAVELAGKIIDWRDEDDESIASPGESESTDYSGSLSQPPNRDFQSILELGQIPGLSQSVIRGILPFVTVNSGLSKVHPELMDINLAASIPGISPETVLRLQRLATTPGDSLKDIISSDQFLGEMVGAEALSKGWHVRLSMSVQDRQLPEITTNIAVLNGDPRAYRILSYVGPLEKVN